MKRIVPILILIALACTTQKNATLPTTGSATVTGRVTSNGSPLPGVNVTLGDRIAGSRLTLTDANGVYRFLNVPPGRYTMRLELAGMTTTTRIVRVGGLATQVADTAMHPASVSESITVAEEAPVVGSPGTELEFAL